MTELLVILVIGLLVLGPKRLPELARSLGRGLAEFRRASTDMRKEFLDVAEEARIDPLGDDPPEKKSAAPAVPPDLENAGATIEPEPAPEREAASAPDEPKASAEKAAETSGE